MLQRARLALAAHVRRRVPPPVERNVGVLQGKEDDDARDGDAARPGRREDKVVLHAVSKVSPAYIEMRREGSTVWGLLTLDQKDTKRVLR